MCVLPHLLADDRRRIMNVFRSHEVKSILPAHRIPLALCGIDLLGRDWRAFLAEMYQTPDTSELIVSTSGRALSRGRGNCAAAAQILCQDNASNKLLPDCR
jgi:hypothetical protein